MVEFWQDLVVDDMSCHVREPDREPHVMGLVAVGGGAGTISRKALVRCFDMFALHRSGASRVSMARPDMPLKHDRAPFEEGALLAASDDAGVRLATDRPPGEGEGACRRGVPDSRSTGAAPPERTVPGRTVPAGIVDGGTRRSLLEQVAGTTGVARSTWRSARDRRLRALRMVGATRSKSRPGRPPAILTSKADRRCARREGKSAG